MHGMDLIGTGGGGIGKAVLRRAQDHEHARKPNEPRESTSDRNDDSSHDHLNGTRIGEAKHPGPELYQMLRNLQMCFSPFLSGPNLKCSLKCVNAPFYAMCCKWFSELSDDELTVKLNSFEYIKKYRPVIKVDTWQFRSHLRHERATISEDFHKWERQMRNGRRPRPGQGTIPPHPVGWDGHWHGRYGVDAVPGEW